MSERRVCAWCGQPGELAASIAVAETNLQYHHDGPDPTCYMQACADMARDHLRSHWSAWLPTRNPTDPEAIRSLKALLDEIDPPEATL